MKNVMTTLMLAIAIATILPTHSLSAKMAPQVQQHNHFSTVVAPQQYFGVQTYSLKVGNIESIATFDGSTLVITEGLSRFNYSRMETLDSSDGQYLGFYSQALDKTIRFPIGGNGRIQVEGAYNNWNWSQMTVTLVNTPVNSPASPWQFHDQIDGLAQELQRQAQEVSSEAALHYQHTPEYPHLIQDANEFQNMSVHLHELAHNHGDPVHMAADLAKLDESFHHLEGTFDRIENNAAVGNGHIAGHTSHVKELLNSMENNLHQLQQRIASLQPHTVLRPPYGKFLKVDALARRLEAESNDLLLDMHNNFSHNQGFRETYAEAYQLLTGAKYVRSVVAGNNHPAIQQTMTELDHVVHHLASDLTGWTEFHPRHFGQPTIQQKLQSVEKVVHELLDDCGVACSQQAPPPQSGIAPPPRIN